MKKTIIIITIVSVLSIITMTLYNDLSFTINDKETLINIDNGYTLTDVSTELKNKGVIKSSQYFIIYSKFKGLEKKIKAGKFNIPSEIKLDELLQQLQNPIQDYIKVTIPEGYTAYQIASKLEEENLGNKQKFLMIAKKGLEKYNVDGISNGIYYQLEGYLYPDTYYVPKHFTEEEIIKMMISRFEEKFSEEFSKRAKELNLTKHQIITMAALIEKEAANDQERRKIAGVIYNRIEKEMPLQIDASVIYGITKGEKHINRLTYDDLKVNSQYNTYKYKTLPPGPIGAPGEESIKAALYPEAHNYLYYVLGDNGHVFSTNYKAHLKNIKKYRD